MMQFSIGDKVVHPIHGSGLVTGVEHQELVEGFEHYYVLEIVEKGLTVFVPMRKVDELGVRPAVSRSELGVILDTLKGKPQRLPEEFKERQGRIKAKLTSGSLVQVGEAVRDLTWHERLDHLTRTDSRLLDQGRERLASEMALVTDSGVEHAHQVVDSALARGMARNSRQEADTREPAAPDEPAGAGTERQGWTDSLRRYMTEALRLRVN